MNDPKTVPVTITPEAAACVAELGMRAELERMIEHALQTVPAVRSIKVGWDPPYDTGDEKHVTLEITRGDAYRADDPIRQQWRRWKIDNFPAEVWVHFGMNLLHETSHAG